TGTDPPGATKPGTLLVPGWISAVFCAAAAAAESASPRTTAAFPATAPFISPSWALARSYPSRATEQRLDLARGRDQLVRLAHRELVARLRRRLVHERAEVRTRPGRVARGEGVLRVLELDHEGVLDAVRRELEASHERDEVVDPLRGGPGG